MNMNKKNSIITFLFILVATTASAQLSFPKMECTSLEGKKITLPADHNGKNTVLGMAFSQKAEKELSTWFQPAYSAFIEKPDANAIIPMDSCELLLRSGLFGRTAGCCRQSRKENEGRHGQKLAAECTSLQRQGR
jgi:hypothetical protein